jgi:hypothetical protein
MRGIDAFESTLHSAQITGSAQLESINQKYIIELRIPPIALNILELLWRQTVIEKEKVGHVKAHSGSSTAI